MSEKSSSPEQEIYQIKITLKGSKPPIWRRVLVPGGISLYQLHQVVQEAMGWTNSHLHQFIIDDEFYGLPSPDDWEPVVDERQYILSQIAPSEKSKFVYEYDFGDSWEHVILVEKIMSPQAGVPYPVCIKGKRHRPPEDVGGIWGYEFFLEALNDPEHEEHDSYLEWWGGEFDAEEFDLESVNIGLQRIKAGWDSGSSGDEWEDEILDLALDENEDEFWSELMSPDSIDDSSPTQSDWSKLYAVAMQIKKLAPWEWMSEEQIFGVQDPETEEIGFVSVMGQLGEHYSIAVYQGSKGLYGLDNFQMLGPQAQAEDLLAIPHLQASFEDRGELTKQDRNVIKELGLKFRGRNEWPLFRSYRPGYFPWYLNAQEARFLSSVLEQVLEMLPRIEHEPTMLDPEDLDDEMRFLVRTPTEDAGKLTWQEHFITVPPPESEAIPIAINTADLEALKRLKSGGMQLEVDLFVIPAQIDSKGSRPSLLYMLLVVERESGMVLGHDLLTADPTLSVMYGQVPQAFIEILSNYETVPSVVWARSELVYQLLSILGQELGFQTQYSAELPALDEARAFMSGMLTR